MPIRHLRIYWDALPQVSASETLEAIQITAYPHMDQQGRKALVRSLEQLSGHRKKAAKATPAILGSIGVKTVGLKEDDG